MARAVTTFVQLSIDGTPAAECVHVVLIPPGMTLDEVCIAYVRGMIHEVWEWEEKTVFVGDRATCDLCAAERSA